MRKAGLRHSQRGAPNTGVGCWILSPAETANSRNDRCFSHDQRDHPHPSKIAILGGSIQSPCPVLLLPPQNIALWAIEGPNRHDSNRKPLEFHSAPFTKPWHAAYFLCF